MIASAEDRAYFQRIAEYEGEVAKERLASHLALPIPERLRRSLALMHLHAARTEPRPIDDPTPFYDRARRLGFYRA